MHVDMLPPACRSCGLCVGRAALSHSATPLLRHLSSSVEAHCEDASLRGAILRTYAVQAIAAFAEEGAAAADGDGREAALPGAGKVCRAVAGLCNPAALPAAFRSVAKRRLASSCCHSLVCLPLMPRLQTPTARGARGPGRVRRAARRMRRTPTATADGGCGAAAAARTSRSWAHVACPCRRPAASRRTCFPVRHRQRGATRHHACPPSCSTRSSRRGGRRARHVRPRSARSTRAPLLAPLAAAPTCPMLRPTLHWRTPQRRGAPGSRGDAGGRAACRRARPPPAAVLGGPPCSSSSRGSSCSRESVALTMNPCSGCACCRWRPRGRRNGAIRQRRATRTGRKT